MAGNKNILFAPGQDGGPYAAGFVNNKHLAELQERRLKAAGYPTGDNVATVFPWMRTITNTLAPFERRVIRNPDWQGSFDNNNSFPVNIDEVRFYAGHGIPANPGLSFQHDLQVKMSISHRKQIAERFLPWSCLNTEMDRYILGQNDPHAFKLPAPYFLSRSHIFMIDVLNHAWMQMPSTTYDPTLEYFHMGLFGFGAEDGEPIQLFKPVHPVLNTVPANSYQTIAFDEERDQPLRDAYITHIGFGAGIITNQRTARQLQDTQVRLIPPEGPKWDGDEFYRIAQLAEQVSFDMTAGSVVVPDCVIHRPIVPYILEPGENFVIEMIHRDMNPLQSGGNTFTMDVSLLGTQPGMKGLEATR
jgi:hypothetical protein